MSVLRDFLLTREVEIREQIKLLRAELVDVRRAKAAIEQPGGGGEDGPDSEVRDSGRTTIKDMVRGVFAKSAAAKGMSAGEVLDAIGAAYGASIERTSLSPQLSRLRESGEVVLQDGRWYPSEPRLPQAVAVAAHHAPSQHYGGGDVLSVAKAAQDAARLASATFVTRSGAEEAMKLARSSVVSREVANAAKLASATFGSAAAMETVLQSGRMTSAAVAAQSAMPNTVKAMQEADRKMREATYGLIGSGAIKDWGSGPKTE